MIDNNEIAMCSAKRRQGLSASKNGCIMKALILSYPVNAQRWPDQTGWIFSDLSNGYAQMSYCCFFYNDNQIIDYKILSFIQNILKECYKYPFLNSFCFLILFLIWITSLCQLVRTVYWWNANGNIVPGALIGEIYSLYNKYCFKQNIVCSRASPGENNGHNG